MAHEEARVNDLSKRGRRAMFFLLLVPCVFGLVRSLDSDIWFLLNHGRYVLEHGIPHIEPFTIHQDFHFVMQQWLSASIFWLAYSGFGAIGVKLVVMFCYMLSIYIVYKICMMISDNYFIISFFVTFLVSIAFIFFMVSRPYVFSTLIFSGEFYLLENYRKTENKKYLYFLPLLSVFLINLQAAMWPMMFIFIAPYIVETFKFKLRPLKSSSPARKPLYLPVLLSVAAGLINPYGVEAMLYLFKSYGYEQINVNIREMMPLDINSAFGKIVLLSLLLVPIIYFSYKKGVKSLRYILLALGTGYMTLSSYRNLFLFALCAYFPLAAYLKDFVLPVKQENNPKRTMFIRRSLIMLLVLLIPLAFYDGYEASKPKNIEYALLNETIDRILDDADASRVVLYTGYNTGNMAEFRGLRTYMDARAEVFVKKNNKTADVFAEYIDLQMGNVYYKEVLSKYGFTHLIVTRDDILFTYLPFDGDYNLAYSDEMYLLYERKG